MGVTIKDSMHHCKAYRGSRELRGGVTRRQPRTGGSAWEEEAGTMTTLGTIHLRHASPAGRLVGALVATDEELGGAPSEGVDVASSSFPSITN